MLAIQFDSALSRPVRRGILCTTALLGFAIVCLGEVTCEPLGDFQVLPDGSAMLLHDVEADEYTRAPQSRVDFEVDGTGLAAVVIDSGINYHHRALKDRAILKADGIPVGHDLTSTDLLDTYGHGSGIAGLIAGEAVPSSGITDGTAPGARIIPIKVYQGSGDSGVSVTRINQSLQWVLDHHHEIEANHHVRIGVVNLSLGFSQNAPEDFRLSAPERVPCKNLIQSLREEEIVVVVASGNQFHDYRSREGMDFPAICDSAISVGAVFDVSIDFGSQRHFYKGTCWVQRAEKDRITPFSQRLSDATSPEINTTIFAPGHNVNSVCKWDRNQPEFSQHGASANNGTSRAAPIVAGAILLIQQRYEKLMGKRGLPKVSIVEQALEEGGVVIHDTEEKPPGTFDSVTSTGQDFRRLDVYRSLKVLDRLVQDERIRLLIASEAGGTDIDLDMPSIE